MKKDKPHGEIIIYQADDGTPKIAVRNGFLCDIEWAIEGGNFYITQSGSITTLTSDRT